MWKRSNNTLLTAFILLLLAGCGEEITPETLLRQAINQAQESADKRDLGEFMAVISEDYNDEGNRRWKDIRALAQLQFIRNPKIHTLKRITRLDMIDDNTAEVTVLVALAGRPIDNVSALSGLRAELMQFELDFKLKQDWQIVRASWQHAEITDFL